jgi:uncharacterized RDD family membrane protein YckC
MGRFTSAGIIEKLGKGRSTRAFIIYRTFGIIHFYNCYFCLCSTALYYMDEFFVKVNNEEKGPYTFEELTDGRLEPHDLVRIGDSDWEKASDIPDFAEYFQYEGYDVPSATNVAGFGIRALAFIIDYFIVSFIVQFFLLLFAKDVLTQVNQLNFNDIGNINLPALRYMLRVYAIALVAYNFVLYILPLRSTLGQRICKLIVVDADGNKISVLQALVRSLCKLLSLSFYGVGFISVLFSQKRQSFNDAVSKTYVVKRNVL